MAKVTATHTYAELEISPAAYDEIKKKLEDAGYHHAFMHDGTIDMFGVGLIRGEAKPTPMQAARPAEATRPDLGAEPIGIDWSTLDAGRHDLG